MRKYLLASVLLLLTTSGSVLADEESDKFLANIAQSVKGRVAKNGVSKTFSAEYGKKTFVMKTLMTADNDTAAMVMDKTMTVLVGDDDNLILEALTLEKLYSGFIDNMIRSKATLKFSAKDAKTGRLYERSMKPKQIKAINIADTAGIVQRQLEIELKAINATVPVNLGNGMIVNRMFIEKPNLILELLVNGKTMPIEQIEKRKDLIELLIVNAMKSKNFAQYVEPCTKAGLDFVLRMKDSWSGKHTDLVMPLSKAKEIFDPNNPIDSVDMAMLTFVYGMRQHLPFKDSKGTITSAIDYADKTVTFTCDVTGDEAKYLYDFARINKLEILNLPIAKIPEDFAQYDCKYRFIYRNPSWEKDIVREVDTKEILRRSNDQYYQDSLSIAQAAEMWNLKSEYKKQIREVHSFDGKNYTISWLIRNKQVDPVNVVHYMNEEINSIIDSFKGLMDILCSMKVGLVLYAKNELTGKERRATIPYDILQSLVKKR